MPAVDSVQSTPNQPQINVEPIEKPQRISQSISPLYPNYAEEEKEIEILEKLEQPVEIIPEVELIILSHLIKNIPGLTRNELQCVMIEFCKRKNYCWAGMDNLWNRLERLIKLGKVAKIKNENNKRVYYFWKWIN